MDNLVFMVLSEDCDGLRRAIQEGADPNASDESQGRSLLGFAAAAGKTRAIETLLELGAEINKCNPNDLGYTPLMEAARDKRTDSTSVLLEHGADVQATDTIGNTAAHHAAVVGAAEVMERLIGAGIELNQANAMGATPLTTVCQHANQAKHFSIVDGKQMRTAHPLYGDHLRTLDVLLGSGARVDAIANSGYSGLHFAAANGAPEVITKLVEAGGNPSLANAKGYTPLHAACDGGELVCVLTLVSAGAEIDRADAYGFAPIHGACMSGAIEVVKALLAAGAALDSKVKEGYEKVEPGMTALDIARAYGHSEIEALLVTASS